MEYSGEGVSVYAEAKGEYTRQLCQYLAPALQTYFLQLLDKAKETEPDSRKHLVGFQTLLEGIADWNIDKVARETQRVAMSSQCDYLEELLTAVFIAHTKVLSAIRLTNRQKKLQITIPKLEHFLHRTMRECARLLWTNTFLFATGASSIERQKNMRQIEALITEGILQGVRSMLPVKNILREYLTTDEGGDTDEEGGEEEEGDEEEEPPAPSDAAPSDAPAPAAPSEATQSEAPPPDPEHMHEVPMPAPKASSRPTTPIVKEAAVTAPPTAEQPVLTAEPPVLNLDEEEAATLRAVEEQIAAADDTDAESEAPADEAIEFLDTDMLPVDADEIPQDKPVEDDEAIEFEELP